LLFSAPFQRKNGAFAEKLKKKRIKELFEFIEMIFFRSSAPGEVIFNRDSKKLFFRKLDFDNALILSMSRKIIFV